MSISRVFSVPGHSIFSDLALLFLRVVAGLAFTLHGWGKIQNPFGWMGPDGFAPGIFQALAALSEFGGGLAWILGLLTPLASLGIASTMAVAFSFHAIVRGTRSVDDRRPELRAGRDLLASRCLIAAGPACPSTARSSVRADCGCR
jgi:uncharacterized membrane protein YphA (DoxX/SURF4 family)